MNPKQPENIEHYNFSKYTSKEGFNSYYVQVDEALKVKPETCLVIGTGDNIVPFILLSQGVEVETFDILKDLNPTYVGNLLDIDNIVKKQYDVVLCCEVLEHLPYAHFTECLEKIKMITKKRLVLSLPVFGLAGYIKIWAPKLINISIPISIRYYKPKHNVMCSEHYWEINSKGHKLKGVLDDIQNKFVVINRFRLKDNPYHMFFIME